MEPGVCQIDLFHFEPQHGYLAPAHLQPQLAASNFFPLGICFFLRIQQCHIIPNLSPKAALKYGRRSCLAQPVDASSSAFLFGLSISLSYPTYLAAARANSTHNLANGEFKPNPITAMFIERLSTIKKEKKKVKKQGSRRNPE